MTFAIPGSRTLRTPFARRIAQLTPLLIACTLPMTAKAQVTVLTQHNDNARSGANLKETILTTPVVNPKQFGKLFAIPADGEIYAQPLYVPNLNIPGKGRHNVIYFATMNNSVYAHDADTGERLWCSSFGTPVPAAEVQFCCPDISKSVGILGTPAIDLASNRIFFVTRNKATNGTYRQYLNAVNILTGAHTTNSPREITAQYQGWTFNPKIQNQRPAVTLANGNIYLAWASHNDGADYHGWVMSYRMSDLTQAAVYMNTPAGQWDKGGIWMAGQGMTVDGEGNLYLSSGNGAFNADGSSTGNSFIKLSPQLTLLDWFTPFDSDSMNAADADLGSSGVLGIPGTQYILGGGKTGVLYLMDSKNMGHFHSAGDQVLQEFQAVFGSGSSHIHGTPIYYNSRSRGPSIFLWGENDTLRAYAFNTRTMRFNTTAYATSTMTAPMSNAFGAMPGGFLSLSSNNNAAKSSILWASTPYDANANNAVVRGVLHAFDAETLKELWNDKSNAVRDEIGRFAKFCPPTIAAGRVYVPNFGPLRAPDGSGQLVVYGVLPYRGYSINCGGGAAGTFIADSYGTGGTTGTLPSGTVINTSGITSPAPGGVYRTWRVGNPTTGFSYLLANLAPKTTYRIRLHFLEPEATAVGQRQFNVTVNGRTALTNFDIFAAAGNVRNKAVVRQITGATNVSGNLLISYDPVVGSPLANGFELVPVTTINYQTGFLASAGLTFNGSAKLAGTGPSAQLTDSGTGEAGSIFTTNRININTFHTDFNFQLTDAVADGFTFTIQGIDPTALGTEGGQLGYGGIVNSVAIKFDIWDNKGEGNSSTGIYVHGAEPMKPATNLAASGIDLHSGHPFKVSLDYDGTRLSYVLLDTVTSARYNTVYTVNIPSIVGSSSAYVGFTGGTGGAGASQNILNWTFTGGE